jgi:uncharacterized protein YjbI with pentapeptide repeats
MAEIKNFNGEVIKIVDSNLTDTNLTNVNLTNKDLTLGLQSEWGKKSTVVEKIEKLNKDISDPFCIF